MKKYVKPEFKAVSLPMSAVKTGDSDKAESSYHCMGTQ